MPTQISVDPQQCSGCLRCALACSFFTTSEREFNPAKSKITALPGWEQGTYEVVLSEDCTGCGICVDYCAFGALSRNKEVDHG